MNDVENPEAEVHLRKDERQGSAQCSDYMNNRGMSASADSPPKSNEQSIGKKGVETWLHNDVHSDDAEYQTPEQIASAKDQPRSDVTDSPKRLENTDSGFGFVNSEDEQDVGGRVTSENDVYERQLLEEAKKREAAAQEYSRFSMQDIFNNPALEDAAKQELRERPPVTPSLSNGESVISLADSRVSHLEQTVCNSENLDRDADRDLQAGHVEISTLLDRLNIGKTSCMHLLKFVQKLYQAEVSYSRNLLSVSRLNMSNIGHTDGFRYASECLCELPMSVRSAHSKIAQTLAESESSLNGVIVKIKKLSDELVVESPKLTEFVRSKRSALSKSKSRHQVAYKQMESIAEHRTASRKIDDPWFTEGQMAHDYTQLISGQVNLKKALTSAYERVAEVEKQRLQVSKDVISSLVDSYGTTIDDCVVPFVRDINKALLVLDEDEEVTDLKKSKRNSQISEQALRMQYEEQETMKFGELFTSPDIIRQGPLQVLDEETRAWVNARFVLTKAGLYWFLTENTTPRPDDSLVLARTSIEQAKAPGLKLVQDGTSYFSWKRAVILRASSIDEYCEWAIALREAIQNIIGSRK